MDAVYNCGFTSSLGSENKLNFNEIKLQLDIHYIAFYAHIKVNFDFGCYNVFIATLQ